MGRFIFRLEKIRKLRKREEDQAARELGKLLSQRAALLENIDAFRKLRRELMSRRQSMQLGEINIPAVAENGMRIEAVGRAETRKRDNLNQLEGVIALQRAELLERSKKRKILDKLKERRLEEHRIEQSRQELREADDLPRNPTGMRIA